VKSSPSVFSAIPLGRSICPPGWVISISLSIVNAPADQ
jgi:hypothetical protein